MDPLLESGLSMIETNPETFFQSFENITGEALVRVISKCFLPHCKPHWSLNVSQLILQLVFAWRSASVKLQQLLHVPVLAFLSWTIVVCGEGRGRGRGVVCDVTGRSIHARLFLKLILIASYMYSRDRDQQND